MSKIHNEIKQLRDKQRREVRAYMILHPEIPYPKVAEHFSVSHTYVEACAKGLEPRKPGRKPKKEL